MLVNFLITELVLLSIFLWLLKLDRENYNKYLWKELEKEKKKREAKKEEKKVRRVYRWHKIFSKKEFK